MNKKFKENLIIEDGIAYIPTISHYSPHEIIDEHKYNRPLIANSLIPLLDNWIPTGIDNHGSNNGLTLVYKTDNRINIIMFYLNQDSVENYRKERQKNGNLD